MVERGKICHHGLCTWNKMRPATLKVKLNIKLVYIYYFIFNRFSMRVAIFAIMLTFFLFYMHIYNSRNSQKSHLFGQIKYSN